VTTTQEIVGKTLSYVEFDLDVFRATQFEAVRVGKAVADWTQIWDQHTRMVGVIDATMPSGRAVHLTKHTVSDTSLWKWNIPPSIRDLSVLSCMKNQFNTTNSGLRVMVRASGNDDTENGYMMRMVTGTGLLTLVRFRNGAATTIASLAVVINLTTPTWMRLDALNISGGGVLVRGKIWQGSASNEPSLFMISVDDFTTPITTAGFSGVGITNLTEDVINVGYFRVKSLLSSTVETHRHAKSTDYLPVTLVVIPDLVSVSTQPGELSLGEGLGTRTKITAQFKDHPSSDLGEFANNGTEWSKFRSRGLFRRGQPFRRITKLLGSVNEEIRSYVLEEFNGPSVTGVYSLISQDPIQLADNSRAQCPIMSNGFLSGTLTAVGTSFNVLPAGIGNIEYPSAGHVSVGGKEVIQFTRVADAFTVVGGVAGRGLFGTTAIQHAAEDRVQLGKYYNGVDAATIVNDQFVNFAGMSTSLIPFSTWLLEVDTYLDRLYTKFIAEPTGVNKLVSSLCEQAGLLIWHDEIENLINLQVLRGIPTTAFEYNQGNTIASSFGVQEQLSKRVTQVWTYYGVRNPCAPLDNLDNYRSTLITIDTEGETEHGEAIIKKVYGDWIPAFGRSTAQRVNDLIIGRFKTPPRKFSFDVMRYSGVQEPAVGVGARAAWWGNQDELGVAYNSPIQITRVDPQDDMMKVTAEEMLFTTIDTAASTDRVITIDSNVNNINLRSLHDSIYPEIVPADLGYNGVTVTFIISASIIVGSETTALKAIDVGSWITGVPLYLRNIGRGQGCGGRGGDGNSGAGEAGDVGGVALYTRYPITLINEGQLWSGGGGGGTGVGTIGAAGSFPGCGGAGQVPGAGGIKSGNPTVGAPGTTEAGGDNATTGTIGGDGGGPGLPGQIGQGFQSNQAGGLAGAAIDGVSFVTIQTVGDIRGGQIN